MAEITQDDLVYALNEEEKTAVIIKYEKDDNSKDEIFIPRSIKFGEQEFVIKMIKIESYCILRASSIKIAPDSEIQKISKDIFASCIKELTIPPSVTELEEGWCKDLNKLSKVTIMPNNKIYKNYNEDLVIGKSDPTSENYDVLIFANRRMSNVTIPPFIKKIAPYSLSIPYIQKVIISPHVTEICQYAFYLCRELETIEFEGDSELEILGQSCFESCPIKNLTIPSKVSELCDGWCKGLSKLVKVTVMKNNKRYKNYKDNFVIGKSDPKSDIFDDLIFASRNITGSCTIPSFIKRIFSYSFYATKIKSILIPDEVVEIRNNAFYFSYYLQKVEISENSELRFLGEEAFANTAIQSFFVPAHLSQICDQTFYRCEKLSSFEFSKNSELKSIGENSFDAAKFENLTIPSSVVELKEGWNHHGNNLKEVTILPNNKVYKNFDNKFVIGKSDPKSDVFDVLIFAFKGNRTVEIPPFIKKIAHSAFNYSDVEKVIISPHLKIIEKYAFHVCTKFTKIVIPENSELQEIGHNSFYGSHITSFCVTSNIQKMDRCALNYCHFIKIVEFDENVDFQNVGRGPMRECEKALIMVPVKLID